MEGEGVRSASLEHSMTYVYTCNRASLDEIHQKACKDPVLALDWDLRRAGVRWAYIMALGQDKNLPGLMSNSLLAKKGSVKVVCNRTATINEMRAAFRRKCRQPSKLGACARSRGNL